MTKKKSNPPSVYTAALKEAKAALAAKIKQLSAAEMVVRELYGEIPRLQSTIAVLENQLNPGSVTAPIHNSAPTLAPGAVPERFEVPDGAGSIPVNADAPAPLQIADIDSIPGMSEEGWQ